MIANIIGGILLMVGSGFLFWLSTKTSGFLFGLYIFIGVLIFLFGVAVIYSSLRRPGCDFGMMDPKFLDERIKRIEEMSEDKIK